ncbi:hypothetical protein ABPG74_006539 [Tetrahymena malaccensis]
MFALNKFKQAQKLACGLIAKQNYFYSILQDEIKLTENCIKMIKQKSRNDKFLRLTVESGEGCGGFAYKFQFDNSVTDDDSVYKENENKILFVCDNLTLNFIKGATVDYESDMMKSAFYVQINPNAEKECSCKSSFSPKDSVFNF